MIRLRLKPFVIALLGAGVVGPSFFAAHDNASAVHLTATCPTPAGGKESSGVLPHRSIPLGDSPLSRPLATDGKRVLMGSEASTKTAGRVHLWVVDLQSTRWTSVPRRAYPPHTFLDHWQIEWPWIVGIAYATSLPAIPANWRLWVGNVVTGRHLILDSYRQHRHPVAGFFPGFAVSGGRVVWEYSSATSMRGYPFPAERIALENLTTHRTKYLTPVDRTARYERITFSGKRVVWESVGISAKNLSVDLMLYDLQSHRLTRLSRNTTRASSSLYPRLAGRHLLFEQGPYDSDYGKPHLVDLGTRGGVPTRKWWQAYRFRQLGRQGLTNTQIGDGLVSWDDSRLLDVTRSKTWFIAGWTIDAIARRVVLVSQMQQNYTAWVVPKACAVPGF